MTSPNGSGLVVFAYDGSDLAKLAIDEAGKQLAPDRDALVVCVWQPFDVGFLPPTGLRLNAMEAGEVRTAAEDTAAAGASLAEEAGFRARSCAVEGAPAWKGIVKLAEERDANLIVLGSHGRSGFPDVLLGSVAGAVAARSQRSVLIVHRRS